MTSLSIFLGRNLHKKILNIKVASRLCLYQKSKISSMCFISTLPYKYIHMKCMFKKNVLRCIFIYAQATNSSEMFSSSFWRTAWRWWSPFPAAGSPPAAQSVPAGHNNIGEVLTKDQSALRGTNLSFHPGIIHLIDEVVCHLQGRLLLLSICSVSWLKHDMLNSVPAAPYLGAFWLYTVYGPFQTKIFPLAPLSRMKQSSRTSSSFPNGLFSHTLVTVMEPVASDTWPVGRRRIHNLMFNGVCWRYLSFL